MSEIPDQMKILTRTSRLKHIIQPEKNISGPGEIVTQLQIEMQNKKNNNKMKWQTGILLFELK